MYHNTTYSDIKNKDQIKNDLLKPLHLYAQKICKKPTEKNNVYTQTLYAECLCLFKGKEFEEIYMISRAATQQFKLINKNDPNHPDDCYSTLFAFYVPWFIDIDKDVKIQQSKNKDSLIKLKDSIIINFQKIYPVKDNKLDPIWVPFYIKKSEEHKRLNYIKLDKDIPVYDMIIL